MRADELADAADDAGVPGDGSIGGMRAPPPAGE
jgi:hypothetical protein